MLQKELISRVAQSTGMTRTRTEELLSASVSVITQALLDGDSVQLMGLGNLSVKEKPARKMSHPQTHEITIVPAKKQLVFKPTNAIKEELK